MNDRDRLQRLQGLAARLERAPASAQRDAILTKIRARAVDVETGETLASVRAWPQGQLRAQAPAAVGRPKRPTKRAVRPRQPRALAAAPPPLPLVVARTRQDGAVDLLQDGRLLCLDDAPVALARPGRPWSGGLRG
jgi:hypothetical protein